MYVKKNLILWAAVFALVLPLMFVGTASARYMEDGAVADSTGTAGQIAPTDGVCVLSIDMAGNMVTDPTITTARDCQARLVDVTAVTTGDTLANVCGITGKNIAGLKYAAPGSSTCVTIDGSGFITGSKSMVNLDRGAVMCDGLGGQLANATVGTLSNGHSITVATKTVANLTAAKCIAYGWLYRGQDATGTPLAFGAKGTDATTAGYCYTSMDWTAVFPTASCPSLGATVAPFNANAAYDWSVASSQCRYAKSIAGKLVNALTKVDGTTTAAGTYVDLSTKTTQGDCLAFGGSWANWIGQAATTSAVGSDANTYKRPNWDYTRQAPDADTGCLHCHSYKSQANGPAERFKDSYLKTGHKNMLRKVTAGQLLVGPDGLPYTTDGTNAINMAAGTINVGGLDKTMRYVYGDWMAALPTVVYDGGAKYGCGACHTAGFKDNTNPGVESIGTVGYDPKQPADSGAQYVAAVTAGHKWDLEGIQCARCHNAAVGPVTAGQIAASSFPTTAPLGGGMGALSAGVGRNNLCFGCHQSIAKAWPSNTTQYDPTLIPTGVSHGAAAGRDFNGHVIGGSFLNSVHAKYNGVNSNSANGGIKLNSLGKYDLFDSQPTSTNTVLEYGSIFKGYSCFQSTSSASPGKTKADGTEIKTKSECEALYGAGSWRADTGGTGAASIQGTCSTCHDVHNSLFVDSQKEAAMRKTCDNCHVDNATTGASDVATPQVAMYNHPTGPNTPFDTVKYESSCVVCHMASQAEENGDQNSMPVHLWRINTDASYNTFPTVGQFYGGTCSVHTGAVQNAPYKPVVYLSDISSAQCTTPGVVGTWTAQAQDRNAQTAADGTYAKAVWVDLDFACGQCHGGSLGTSAVHNSAPYFDKTYLSITAKNMHLNTPTARSSMKLGAADYQVLYDGSLSTDSTGTTANLTYSWSTGETGAIASHTFASATPQTVTLTVTDTNTGGVNSTSKTVTPKYSAGIPTALTGVSVTPAGLSATANWTLGGGVAPYMVRVNWGDGSVVPVTQPLAGAGSLIHNFATARTYTVTVYALDSGSGGNQTSSTVTTTVTTAASSATVSGLVTRLSGTPVSGAAVTLKVGNVVKKLAYTNASGNYSISGVATGTYDVYVVKSGVTFAVPAATGISVSGSPVTQNVTATN